MVFKKYGLILGAMLASFPLAAEAAGPNAPVASNGEEAAPVNIGRSRVTRAYEGTSQTPSEKAIDDALASMKGGELSSEKLEWLATLTPMGAPIGTESIIGRDTRRPVANTTRFPFRAVVLITFSTPDGGARCTGWMIGDDTVATAGHCVHEGNGGSFYSTSSYEITPGYTGSSAPYGSCNATNLYTVRGWARGGRDDYDYGAIKLDCNIGETVGSFGFYWTTNSSSLKRRVKVTGFPGDKPMTMWFSKGRVTVVQKRRVFYKNDTTGGMSGSPVYHGKRGCGPCSTAIHAYGTYNGPPYSSNNHGTRITRAVYRNLHRWINR